MYKKGKREHKSKIEVVNIETTHTQSHPNHFNSIDKSHNESKRWQQCDNRYSFFFLLEEKKVLKLIFYETHIFGKAHAHIQSHI